METKTLIYVLAPNLAVLIWLYVSQRGYWRKHLNWRHFWHSKYRILAMNGCSLFALWCFSWNEYDGAAIFTFITLFLIPASVLTVMDHCSHDA